MAARSCDSAGTTTLVGMGVGSYQEFGSEGSVCSRCLAEGEALGPGPAPPPPPPPPQQHYHHQHQHHLPTSRHPRVSPPRTAQSGRSRSLAGSESSSHHDWRTVALAFKSNADHETQRHTELIGRLDTLIDLYAVKSSKRTSPPRNRPHISDSSGKIGKTMRQDLQRSTRPAPRSHSEAPMEYTSSSSHYDIGLRREVREEREEKRVAPPRRSHSEVQAPEFAHFERMEIERKRVAPRRSYCVVEREERQNVYKKPAKKKEVESFRALQQIERLERHAAMLKKETRTLASERDELTYENTVYRERLHLADSALNQLKTISNEVSKLDVLQRKATDIDVKREQTLRNIGTTVLDLQGKWKHNAPLIRSAPSRTSRRKIR